MTGCVIAIALAVVLLAATGGSLGGSGLLLAVLVCPLTMGAMMWFLMRSPQGRAAEPGAVTPGDEAHVRHERPSPTR